MISALYCRLHLGRINASDTRLGQVRYTITVSHYFISFKISP
jgi:hypothetical protein